MAQVASKTRLSNQFPGFSARFNELLDRTGIASLEYGRARALAEQFGASKSGARKWIREDTPPRQLRAIVAEICGEIDNITNSEQVLAWLYHGNAKDSPFVSPSKQASQAVSEIDHTVLSAVYIAVHEHAKTLGIDLQTMSPDTLDMVYQPLIAQVQNTGVSALSPELLTSLITLANKQ